MVLVAVFGAALLVTVLLSGLAARSVLSTSLLFLVGGALVSDGFLGLIHITPDSEIVAVTADLALFAVLFTDGMHVSFLSLRDAWRTPARALGLGMPLAFVGMALVTHVLVGLDWTTSFLVGAVLASVSPKSRDAFEPLGESLAELAKFAALLVFGAQLTPHLFGDLSVGGYVVVVLAIVLIRPGSLLVSLIGTRTIDRREKLTAAWFGPKGFASVVYGLLVLQSGIPHGEEAYTLIAICIAFSIVAHSTTDVPIARMFDVEDLVGIPDDDEAEGRDRESLTPARKEEAGRART